MASRDPTTRKDEPMTLTEVDAVARALTARMAETCSAGRGRVPQVTVARTDGDRHCIEVDGLLVYDSLVLAKPPTVDGCLASIRLRTEAILAALPPEPTPPGRRPAKTFHLKAGDEPLARVVTVVSRFGDDLQVDLGQDALLSVARHPGCWLVRIRSTYANHEGTIPGDGVRATPGKPREETE